jgi:ribosomal protein S18 acetylase RimI-like enzyme
MAIIAAGSGQRKAARRMPAVRVLDALAAGREGDAAELVFEYMAATQAETGHPWPACIDQLPAVLARECRDLAAAYAPPGVLLLAYCGRPPVGCVGLAAREPAGTAEVKRLYVRPAHRGGIGAVLMSHAHRLAAERGFTRLVLDVLPARTAVIDFYRRLGYTETDLPRNGPAGDRAAAPGHMIQMARPVLRADLPVYRRH